MAKASEQEVPETFASYQSKSSPRPLRIQREDVDTLKEGEWLNDTMIEFFLQRAEDDLPDELRQRAYVFNTFFYGKLQRVLGAAATPKAAHASVARWTRWVDLFEKDFIVVPIHCRNHWTLAVICFPGRPTSVGEEPTSAESGQYILFFDSLPEVIGPYADTIASNIRTYLTEEWRSKRGSDRPFTDTTMPLYKPATPRQPNHSDCGVYVVLNFEAFFRSAPSFGDRVVLERMSFTADDAAQKRESGKHFIWELHAQQHPDLRSAREWRAKHPAAAVQSQHADQGSDSTYQQQPVPLQAPTLRRSTRVRRPARRCHLPQCL